MSASCKYFDVVVVGAGPAGATAAYMLACQGYRVVMVDKNRFPRPKLCAGLITWKTIDLITRLFGYSMQDLKTAGIVTHACRNYNIFYGSKEIVRRRLDFPFHFVDRKIYDYFWVQAAQDAGAEFIGGDRVIEVEKDTQRITLQSGMHLQAKVIIGADGVWSKVRQAIFPQHDFKQTWQSNLAMTIETLSQRTSSATEDEFASLYFGYVPWGYAWRFPRQDLLILGIGGLGCKLSQSMTRPFRQFLSAIGQPAGQLDDWQGHALPFGNFVDPPGWGRILLAGDACGLADPLLGEGIFYAHRSGQLAAQAVIAAGTNSNHLSSAYRRSLNRHVLRELRWIKFYRNLLFWGGHRRRFRGLRLFFRLIPKRLEAAVQGKISFSNLIFPRFR